LAEFGNEWRPTVGFLTNDWLTGICDGATPDILPWTWPELSFVQLAFFAPPPSLLRSALLCSRVVSSP
jgi:hypothetical protein